MYLDSNTKEIVYIPEPEPEPYDAEIQDLKN